MSFEAKVRIFSCLLFSGISVWKTYSCYKMDECNASEGLQRYNSYMSMGYESPLLFVIPILAAILLCKLGFEKGLLWVFSTLFVVVLHISLYYAILMPALPWLRKYICTRTCASLWMIPNLLYLTQSVLMKVSRPLVVLRFSKTFVVIFIGIWLIGFLGVFLYHIAAHLFFRRSILKNAVPVSDDNVLKIWKAELQQARYDPAKIPLMVSPDIRSPLSVGIFTRSMRVLLPEKKYSETELTLVLRHEIVHVCRKDSQNKFFLMLCAAICWFNPLMWHAMKKCADDLELSCDETVLLNAEDHTRRQYANLILNTAGENRGFTTCLSSAASTVRYRLSYIVKPRKLRSGAFMVGLIIFSLLITSGYTAVALGSVSGKAAILDDQISNKPNIRFINEESDGQMITLNCTDPQKLVQWLANQELCPVTVNSSFYEDSRHITIALILHNGVRIISLWDQYITVCDLGDNAKSNQYYYVPGGIDWEYLDSILLVHPTLNLYIFDTQSDSGIESTASLVKFQEIHGSLIEDREPDLQPGEQYSCLAWDKTADEMQLSFSLPVVSEYTVRIEPLDGGEATVLHSSELQDGGILPIPEFPARYTFEADLRGLEDTIYRTEFVFEIMPKP